MSTRIDNVDAYRQADNKQWRNLRRFQWSLEGKQERHWRYLVDKIGRWRDEGGDEVVRVDTESSLGISNGRTVEGG